MMEEITIAITGTRENSRNLLAGETTRMLQVTTILATTLGPQVAKMEINHSNSSNRLQASLSRRIAIATTLRRQQRVEMSVSGP